MKEIRKEGRKGIAIIIRLIIIITITIASFPPSLRSLMCRRFEGRKEDWSSCYGCHLHRGVESLLENVRHISPLKRTSFVVSLIVRKMVERPASLSPSLRYVVTPITTLTQQKNRQLLRQA